MEKRVFEVISRVLDIPIEKVGPGTAYGQTVQWDSLQHMNLILALEGEFGVRFSDQEIVSLRDAKSIIAAIKRYTGHER